MKWPPKFGPRVWEVLAILTLIVVLAIVFLPALSRSRESARRSSCMNNLKQMGIVFKMYANEVRGGKYPPVSAIANNWMPDMHSIYPEYLTDLSVLACPESPYTVDYPYFLRSTWEHPDSELGAYHPDCVSSLYYNYTGYALTDDESALALYRTYRSAPWGSLRGENIEVEVDTWANSDVSMRGSGSNGAIPIMWDRVPLDDWEFSHWPAGINVLHQDGHVQFVPYSPLSNSSNFPATYIAAETFGNDVPRLSVDCY